MAVCPIMPSIKAIGDELHALQWCSQNSCCKQSIKYIDRWTGELWSGGCRFTICSCLNVHVARIWSIDIFFCLARMLVWCDAFFFSSQSPVIVHLWGETELWGLSVIPPMLLLLSLFYIKPQTYSGHVCFLWRPKIWWWMMVVMPGGWGRTYPDLSSPASCTGSAIVPLFRKCRRCW